jgi:arsenate reductase (thioredoxin)
MPHPRLLWVFASIWILMTAMPSMGSEQKKEKTFPQPTVIFVCEHGAAKSVIGAAWFNKLAAERHLPFHAIARGITPQHDLSASAVAGLRRDAVAFPSSKPRALTQREASEAFRIVAFCPLPTSLKASRVDTFDVPAPKDGYDQSRDAILAHLKALLAELTTAATADAK